MSALAVYSLAVGGPALFVAMLMYGLCKAAAEAKAELREERWIAEAIIAEERRQAEAKRWDTPISPDAQLVGAEAEGFLAGAAR
jgi:hypothetical protein